jgi:RNA polymerase sigma-54 factor
MALELKQQLKVSQQLVMTPQLQQAIKLLQLSSLELANVVQQELVENPVLEEGADEDAGEAAAETGAEPTAEAELEAGGEGEANGAAEAEAPIGEELRAEPAEPDSADEVTPSAEDMVGDVDWENYMESRPQTSLSRPDEDRPSLEENLTPRTSLCDHLRWQIGFLEWTDAERETALQVIGNLTDDGYLDEDIAAIAVSAGVPLATAEAVLLRVQQLDPVGVASRDLRECLRMQARVGGIDEPLVLAIIDRHLDLLQRKDYRGIARLEGVEIEQVSRAATLIGGLEPRPGRQFAEDEPIYITPDIFVYKIGDDYHVVLNEDGLPKLRVSPTYRAVLNRKEGASKETREYVREKLRGAVWLIKSIHQRQRTIMKVMQSILRFQRDFFDQGSESLRPLNLRDVAEDIGMHESTVSRVTTNKYVQTPHGIFELKYFFSSSIQTEDGNSIAAESVKEKIRDIIRREDPVSPLSDQRIAELLRQAKIHIARRTVTKYREALRILSSTRRRQIG